MEFFWTICFEFGVPRAVGAGSAFDGLLYCQKQWMLLEPFWTWPRKVVMKYNFHGDESGGKAHRSALQRSTSVS